MRSIRGESQEQTFEGRRSSSQSSGRTLQVGTGVEGGPAEVGGASSRGFRAGARTTSSTSSIGRSFESEEVGVRIAGQVAVLEENRIDNWEGVEELRRLRREVENFRREAKTSELSTELAIPGPMNPSARMASLIDASDAKRRCVESTVR